MRCSGQLEQRGGRSRWLRAGMVTAGSPVAALPANLPVHLQQLSHPVIAPPAARSLAPADPPAPAPPCSVAALVRQGGWADADGWVENWEKAWQVGGAVFKGAGVAGLRALAVRARWLEGRRPRLIHTAYTRLLHLSPRPPTLRPSLPVPPAAKPGRELRAGAGRHLHDQGHIRPFPAAPLAPCLPASLSVH